MVDGITKLKDAPQKRATIFRKVREEKQKVPSERLMELKPRWALAGSISKAPCDARSKREGSGLHGGDH